MRRIIGKPIYLTLKQFNNYKKYYLTIQQFNECTQSQRQLNDGFSQFIQDQHQHNNNTSLDIVKCTGYSLLFSTGCFVYGGFLLILCKIVTH